MLRILFHIFLGIAMLTATTGVAISKHYCAGKLKTATLLHDYKCCGERANMPENCCENETEVHQLDTDVNMVSADINVDFSPELLATIFVIFDFPDNRDLISCEYLNFRPPLPETPDFIRFRNLRI